MITKGPCYRENCVGPMKYVDGIFVCESCGLGSLAQDYISWYEEDGVNNNDPDDDYNGVPSYEELYDEEGEIIFCPRCLGYNTPLKIHYGIITCPRCGAEFDENDIINV